MKPLNAVKKENQGKIHSIMKDIKNVGNTNLCLPIRLYLQITLKTMIKVKNK